jgi:hypothetical protein
MKNIQGVVFYLLILLLLILLLLIFLLCPAVVTASTIEMDFRDNRLSVSAVDADIKDILLRLSEEAGIYVQFPKALQKKISLNLSDVELEKALPRLLKGLNYATVFSIPLGTDRPQVSKVYVFEDYKISARARRSARRERQTRNRISQYEKRIASIQKRLDRVSHDSSAGKRYQRQIRSYKQKIDRLERQIR